MVSPKKGREVMANARATSSSSLSDVLLALKMSAEESSSATRGPSLDRRTSTSLDELLAFEMAQESDQSMTDFVAAGIMPPPSKPSRPSNISPSPSSGNDQGEQLRILERIREEREQRELELALKASERESMATSKVEAVSMNHPANYLYGQQKAMKDWARPGFTPPEKSGANPPDVSSTAPTVKARPRAKRENSMRSIDSEGRRRELLERGTSETKHAWQKVKRTRLVHLESRMEEST
jgi:hypothetical protein